MKDVVLERTKTYSLVQLFFFIVHDLDAFYEMKILDVAANRPPQYLKKRFGITKKQKETLQYKAVQSSNSLYLVHNSLNNNTYTVDLDTGICSCQQGNTGKPCKHQIFVAKDLKKDLDLCLQVTEEARKKLKIVATGCLEIQDGWYDSTTNVRFPQNTILPEKNLNLQNCNTINSLNNSHIEEDDNQTLNFNLNEGNHSYEDDVLQFDEMFEKIKNTCKSDINYFLPGMKSMVNS